MAAWELFNYRWARRWVPSVWNFMRKGACCTTLELDLSSICAAHALVGEWTCSTNYPLTSTQQDMCSHTHTHCNTTQSFPDLHTAWHVHTHCRHTKVILTSTHHGTYTPTHYRYKKKNFKKIMCNYQLHVLGCHPTHGASVPMDQCLCLFLVVCRTNIQDHPRVPPPSVSSFKLTFVVLPLMTADPKTCVLRWSVVRSNGHGHSCSGLNVTPSLHNARCGEIFWLLFLNSK